MSQPPVPPSVDKPKHYLVGGIETFDFIIAKNTPEESIGFCKGNIIKYISRAPHKNGLEDYYKARWYINKLIAILEESNVEEVK